MLRIVRTRDIRMEVHTIMAGMARITIGTDVPITDLRSWYTHHLQ